MVQEYRRYDRLTSDQSIVALILPLLCRRETSGSRHVMIGHGCPETSRNDGWNGNAHRDAYLACLLAAIVVVNFVSDVLC